VHLNYEAQKDRTHFITDVLTEATRSVDYCVKQLEPLRSLKITTDTLMALKSQIQTDIGTITGTLNIYKRVNPSLLDNVDADTHLNESRKHVDQLCALLDVARYTSALVSTTEETIKQHPTDWYSRVFPFLTAEKEGQVACHYMPDSYREASKKKNTILENCTNRVKDNLQKQETASYALVEMSYLPVITLIHKTVTEKRQDLMSDESLFPKLQPWPTDPQGSISRNTRIIITDLLDIQRCMMDAQHYALQALDSLKMQLSVAQEMRFRCLLVSSKKFIESHEATISQVWDGVQSLVLALAEIYVLEEC